MTAITISCHRHSSVVVQSNALMITSVSIYPFNYIGGDENRVKHNVLLSQLHFPFFSGSLDEQGGQRRRDEREDREREEKN